MFLPRFLKGLGLHRLNHGPPILLFLEVYYTALAMLTSWQKPPVQASLSRLILEMVRDGHELKSALLTKTSGLREDILLAFCPPEPPELGIADRGAIQLGYLYRLRCRRL
jgi:hypothetical protein